MGIPLKRGEFPPFAVQVYYCLVVQEISVFSDLRGLQDSEEEKKKVRFTNSSSVINNYYYVILVSWLYLLAVCI